MNMFVVYRSDMSDQWKVRGPLQLRTLGSETIEMSDGQKYPVNNCFKTKGGATKSCYRRNYDAKGGV